MKDNLKSPHILNASTNLVGFCFLILSSIKILKLNHQTFIDDITVFSFISFMTSSMFSFFAIRSESRRKGIYEMVADFSFLIGLTLIFLTAMLVALNIID